jgi:hypothetical protein
MWINKIRKLWGNRMKKHKVRIKGYWNWDSIIPKYIFSHKRTIIIPSKNTSQLSQSEKNTNT